MRRKEREEDDSPYQFCETCEQMYEKAQKFNQAVLAWEMVRKIDPTDDEAQSKAHQLSTSATIQKGKYE